MEEDGSGALDRVDGDAEAFRLLDEHPSGDVAGDVVRGGGEVGGRGIEGMYCGEVAGDAAHALDMGPKPVRQGVEAGWSVPGGGQQSWPRSAHGAEASSSEDVEVEVRAPPGRSRGPWLTTRR